MLVRRAALVLVGMLAAGCGVAAPEADGEPPADDARGELADAPDDASESATPPFDARQPMDATLPRDASALDVPARDGGGAVPCAVNGMPGECIDVGACAAPRVATPGFCPGAANIQCCTMAATAGWCPAVMSTPNAGLVEEPGEGGCPAGMLRVEAFCVDRFEAALLEVRADGTTASWSPYYNPGSRRMRAASLRGAVPQGYINGVQAAAACAEAGKRLCTDAEWLRACRSASGRTYPYGAARMPGVCNDARAPHPAVQCFGSSASWVWSNLGYPGINQQADTVTRTGARAGCVTVEGAFDMMGNLHEWTADPAGTFRGGFYADTTLNGPGCLYATTAHDRGHWDYSTGFRCCADPR